MSEPFLGEIRVVAFTFAPRGFAFCQGQFLAITQNQSLFSLFGTSFGGNGITTFGLPDMRGRIPLHVGTGYPLGSFGGTESVALTEQQLPAHSHAIIADSGAATTDLPTGGYLARGTKALYATPTSLTQLTSRAEGTGGALPHENRMPYLVMNFIVSLQGIPPSRN